MEGRINPDKAGSCRSDGFKEFGLKIILANPRGFCAGVNMAIESLERALELFGTPIYVYHEIVHNRPVVDRFRKQGVLFVDDISEVPKGSTLLYSAHGVAPAIREASAARRLRAIGSIQQVQQLVGQAADLGHRAQNPDLSLADRSALLDETRAALEEAMTVLRSQQPPLELPPPSSQNGAGKVTSARREERPAA